MILRNYLSHKMCYNNQDSVFMLPYDLLGGIIMATKRQLKKQDAMKTKAVQAAETAAEIKETTEQKVAEVKNVTEEKVAEVKKAAPEKAAEVKKAVTEKAVEVKKAVTEKAAEVKKATEEKVEEAGTAVKKAAKKAAPKKEIKTTLIVEHQGKQVGDKEMIAAVKKSWTKSGKKVGDIKSMTLYVKPEEEAVYYVINDTETGKVEF